MRQCLPVIVRSHVLQNQGCMRRSVGRQTDKRDSPDRLVPRVLPDPRAVCDLWRAGSRSRARVGRTSRSNRSVPTDSPGPAGRADAGNPTLPNRRVSAWRWRRNADSKARTTRWHRAARQFRQFASRGDHCLPDFFLKVIFNRRSGFFRVVIVPGFGDERPDIHVRADLHHLFEVSQSWLLVRLGSG
jgi:hypothetical protein